MTVGSARRHRQAPPPEVHQEAVLGGHTVSVRRRSGDTFSPILAGGKVLPGEAIRYFSTSTYWGATIRFHIVGPDQTTILEEEVPLNIQGAAWLDSVAPAAPGVYQFHAHARSYPFLPMSHLASTTFEVSEEAPSPPAPPPDTGAFADIKKILILAAVVIGLAAVAPLVSRIGKRATDT